MTFKILKKAAAIVAVAAALSGCHYKSERNLLAGAKTYTGAAFFDGSTRYFKSEDGKAVLKVSIGSSSTTIKRHYLSGTAPSAVTAKYFADVGIRGENIYAGITQTSEGTNYYAFTFNKTNQGRITWITPSEVTSVKTLRSLRATINGDYKAGRTKTFRGVSSSEGSRLVRRAEAAAALKKQEQKKKKTTPAPAPRTSSLYGLDIGDGVYIQGVFSDELAFVTRIDHASGKVKVRRALDGTTKWVYASSLITREQRNMNNLGRTAVGAAIVVCMFSPDSCKKK